MDTSWVQAVVATLLTAAWACLSPTSQNHTHSRLSHLDSSVRGTVPGFLAFL